MKTRSTFKRKAANCAKEFNVSFASPRTSDSGIGCNGAQVGSNDCCRDPGDGCKPNNEQCSAGMEVMEPGVFGKEPGSAGDDVFSWMVSRRSGRK